jgi:hypothetical protein
VNNGDASDQSQAIEQPTMIADGKSYSDLTGRFPNRSDTGNLYILVLYFYDNNVILVEPLQNRSNHQQVQAYKRIIDQANKGTTLQIHWMDNEASAAVKETLKKSTTWTTNWSRHTFTDAMPLAEQAIRTFKNHFIAKMCSKMCSAAEDFPIQLWDRLLRQAEITLNLMQTSRVNLSISAQEAINGPFNYNKTPLAPPGCKVLIHEKPSQQTSWGPHGVVGWYLGPASEHYRCYQCYFKNT